jgi:hypothetical protein
MNREERLKDMKQSLDEAKEYREKCKRKSKKFNILSIICILLMVAVSIIYINLVPYSTTTVTEKIYQYEYDEDGNVIGYRNILHMGFKQVGFNEAVMYISGQEEVHYDENNEGYYISTNEVPNPKVEKAINIVLSVGAIIGFLGLLFAASSLGLR